MATELTVELLYALVEQVCHHRGYRKAASIYGIEMDDLKQEAALAILRQSKTYDPEKGPIENACIVSAHRAVARMLKKSTPVNCGRSVEDLRKIKAVAYEENFVGDGKDTDSGSDDLYEFGHFQEQDHEDIEQEDLIRVVRARIAALLGEHSGTMEDAFSGELDSSSAALVMGLSLSTYRRQAIRARATLLADPVIKASSP